jgi:hypothetical protein
MEYTLAQDKATFRTHTSKNGHSKKGHLPATMSNAVKLDIKTEKRKHQRKAHLWGTTMLSVDITVSMIRSLSSSFTLPQRWLCTLTFNCTENNQEETVLRCHCLWDVSWETLQTANIRVGQLQLVYYFASKYASLGYRWLFHYFPYNLQEYHLHKAWLWRRWCMQKDGVSSSQWLQNALRNKDTESTTVPMINICK